MRAHTRTHEGLAISLRADLAHPFDDLMDPEFIAEPEAKAEEDEAAEHIADPGSIATCSTCPVWGLSNCLSAAHSPTRPPGPVASGEPNQS
jgi:hypothetical protein